MNDDDRVSEPFACPCGSGALYAACCEPLHDRAADAETAEQLMRSRYAAYAKAREGYLTRTWHPRTRPERVVVDPVVRWRSLEVTEVVDGGPEDAEGVVVFRAHSVDASGSPEVLEERSSFGRHRGRWVYVGPTQDAPV